MEKELRSIVDQANQGVRDLRTLSDFDAFKSKYIGPKGLLTQTAKGIGKLSPEERPKVGKWVNEVKKELEALMSVTQKSLESAALAQNLGPAIDPTLPSPDQPRGTRHPLSQVIDEVVSIFRKLGFSIAKGPEIDSEWYCFDALNTPETHPARDDHDTLFLPKSTEVGNVSRKGNERYILRSHTSTVQIRTMLEEQPPLRILAPGRAFRRDTVDATHSANFHQIEGLLVDKHVTVKDLKATLDFFFHELFGKDAKIRLRPSFFPFTEPSFEVDFMSPKLGKLSNQWIEIMGCGIVDPEVFKSLDYDSEAWTGYAFGMGPERIAMIMHGIDDIRYFYQNDLRFLHQFR